MENNNNKIHDLLQALSEYERTFMAARHFAARTRSEYRNDISQLIDYLLTEHVASRPEQVHRLHLEGYLAHLDRLGRKGTTRYRKVMAMRSFFGFLVDQGVIEVSPADKLIPPTREQTEPRWLSEAEYKRLVEVVRFHPRDAAIVEVLLQTGIRLSEIARLCLQDIELPAKITKDPDNLGHLVVIGKGRKTRTIGLNYKACAALKAYLAVRPAEAQSAHLFLSKYQQPLGKRSIEKMLTKYLAAAQIHGASVHTIRHTFGTHHAKAGTPLPQIRDMMGHANISTTSIYVATAKTEQNRSLQQNAL